MIVLLIILGIIFIPMLIALLFAEEIKGDYDE